jgi:cytochrome c oxidase subunit 2
MTNWLGMPPLATTQGGQIDNMIGWMHIFMFVLFIGWGGFFAYALVRFRRSRNPVASYTDVQSHASN